MEKVIRILHLENSPEDVMLIDIALKKSKTIFERLVVDKKDQFVSALETFSPDIIFANHSISSFNAFEALAIFTETGMRIPFLVITAANSDEVAIELIRMGADDYLLKDKLARLPEIILHSLEKFRIEKERISFLEELINSEKRYRALIENSADAVVILDERGNPTYISPSVENVLGYSQEEIIRMDMFALAHPDDITELGHVMQKVLAKPGVPMLGHTGRMMHKDGNWRWMEATVVNLLQDPAVRGIVDNFRDITEKKSAQQAIINNEHKFRSLIENNADGMAILSAKGQPIYISPSVKNILGYTDQEAMQLNLFSMAHPDDVPLLIDAMEQAMANPGKAINSKIARIQHKNGEWRWIEGAITNRLHDPVIGGVVNNFRDVTDRKHAEHKINQLNRLYAFISQINQTIVHSGDEHTVFKEACRIALEVGGFKAAWIGMIDENAQKINLVEESGLHAEDVAKFANVAYVNGGVIAQVLKTKTHYYCNDIRNNLIVNTWKWLADERGYESLIVLPIKKTGSIIGLFSIYASEINFFTSEEIALLGEVTGDISFALDSFEKQSQKLQAEELLKHKEFSLNQAQAIAHLGSWELDLSTGIEIWSDEACRIYGLSTNDHIQSYESWMTYIHPEDRDYVLNITKGVRTLLDNDLAYYYRIIRKDGIVRHIYSQTQFQFNNAGELIGLSGVMHDVTDIETSQKALQDSESNLQAIFENSSEGFILTGLDGTIKSFNKKLKDFIRLNSGKEIKVGDSIMHFIDGHMEHQIKQAISKVLLEENLEFIYCYKRKDGEIYWFNYMINPVYINKAVAGLSITVTDITKKKQAKELLQRSESNLNAIIENTDAFIYSLDTNFNYLTFNKGLKNSIWEVYGIDLHAGYNVFDIINSFHPEQVQEWQNVYSRVLKGETVKFERETTEHGFYICLSFSIHPISENENIIGLSCFVNDITKEKRVDRENRFKANLLNTIGQAAVATDLNGVVNYWNKAAEHIYGWTEQEAIGRNILDLTPSVSTKSQAEEIMETLRQGKDWSGEFRVQRKNGTHFAAFITDSPVYDEHQNHIGIVGISSDITEKRANEWLLDKATSLARIGSYEADLENYTMFWSPMTKEIYEVESDYVPRIDEAAAFYTEGPNLEILFKAYTEAIENGIPFDIELQIITAKGNVRWARVIGEAERINGKSTRLYGSVQDIDKMKKAELEIFEIYKEKNLVLESIGDAFFAVDKNWIVNYWNKEAEVVLQCPKQKIIGQNLWDIFSDSIDTPFYANYHKAVEENTIQHFESYYKQLDVWFDVTAYPSPNGLSVYFRDITERILSEKHLQELNINLQDFTEELILSNKGLEQFSYMVSHNLRAPIANIMGLADLLGQDMYSSEEKKELLSGLLSNVKRLDDVVIDLNTILRVKKGMSENNESVNLHDLIENIQLSIHGLILEKNVQIETDFGSVPELTTIKSYLYSIFYNLIINSIKYHQPGVAPVIEIKSSVQDGKKIISFRDNGMGIDLSKKGDQVFGLYKRFHHHVEGKGMGLYMVKTQVEMLSGKISIKSQINKGTEFLIEFKSGR